MLSSATLPLCCAALAIASAFSVNADNIKLPLKLKSLNCDGYPTPDKIVEEVPEWTKLYADKLIGVPTTPPVVYSDPVVIEPGNAENPTGNDNDIRGCKKTGQWAATYDDGPSKYTQNVLKALDEAGGVKATFFVVGSRICESASAMIEAVNAGHEIGVHTWSHPRLAALSNGQIIAEIKWTEEAIFAVTGIRPKYMRPPYGNMDDRVRFIIKAMGYTPIMWSTDTDDWKFNYVTDRRKAQEGIDAIKYKVEEYISNEGDENEGTISLQHDLSMIPTEAARDVIELVKNGGWSLVPMTTCLGDESYAQNAVIVAGKPHGKITPVPDKKADSSASSVPPAPEVKKEPTTTQDKAPQTAQNVQGSAENTATSFSGSLHEIMFMAVAAGLGFFALAL